MKKEKLLRMRRLKATPKMVKIAQKDVPKKVTINTYWGPHEEIRREYQLYLRCSIEDGILKAALYYPDNLRAEGRMPSYEVFVDRGARCFITYDCINKKWRDAKLDRLDWPHYLPMHPRIWVSSDDAKAVAVYFGSEKQGYEAILDYQLELRKEAVVRRHQKETAHWDEDLALTPELPKDWDSWVDKVGIPENFMFYRYKKRGVKTGYCTYCGKDVLLRKKPHHNMTGRCPCCRHEVTYKSVGRMSWRLTTKEVCVYLIQKRPDGFVVREFWADRSYKKEDYKNPKVSCVERWRMIYDHELSARSYYWGVYKQLSTRWIAGAPSYSWMGANSIFNNHGGVDGRVYGKTLPHLAKGVLKHTGLAEWIYAQGLVANADKYMSVCRNLPQFEQIWKAGLPKLTEECWNNSSYMDEFIKEPQSPSLVKALGIDKQELGRLRQMNGGRRLLKWLQWEKETGKHIPDEVLEWYCDQKIAVNDLEFIWDKMNAVQVYHYLQRQWMPGYEPVQQVITTWRDYLSMAERLGIDTNDEIVYRVKLLRQRHDELVLRCKQADLKEQAIGILRKFPNVDRVCRSIKKKYEYADDKYAILVPKGALDIIVEGSVLCHCVGSSDRYWDRIERNEAFILFLRKASDPELPYYTLEVEPDGTVRQKRTKFDRQESDIEEATKFLAKWQTVVAKRLTKGDRKKAADSRVLREQEFEQMRRDNVIIHTGDLAGKRLVDVLTADLMETAA